MKIDRSYFLGGWRGYEGNIRPAMEGEVDQSVSDLA